MVRGRTWAALVILTATTAWGQQRDPAQPAAPARPGATAGQPGTSGQRQAADQHVATCLTIGNQEEIAILSYAVENAKDKEVKDLAKSMIDDHEKFVGKLRKFTGTTANFDLRGRGGNREGSAREGAAREGAQNEGTTRAERATEAQPKNINPAASRNEPPRTTGATAAGTPGPTGSASAMAIPTSQLTSMELAKARECVRLTLEGLSKEKGRDFDIALLGQQCVAHVTMLATLRSAESSVSPELLELIRDGEKTTEEHKEHLEKLKKKLTARSSD